MIQNDKEIAKLCEGSNPMISPFVGESVNVDEEGNKILSYGTSSFSYDFILYPELKILRNCDKLFDPKNITEDDFYYADLHKDETGEYFILPPHSCALGRTVETVNIPRDVSVIMVDKSTYARSFVKFTTTLVDSAFGGTITLEVKSGSRPVKVYANEGCCQGVFMKGSNPRVSYADKGGKYMGQKEITLGKV